MLGSKARHRSGHPPNMVGCPHHHQWLGMGPTVWGSRERGGRADLVAFLDDVWADGHDLVVEDVVLLYLAVDQRQVGPEALAVQRVLRRTGVEVSDGGTGCGS